MTDKGSIVITGASTGIGAACAIGLAERGYTVFAGVRRLQDSEVLKKQAGERLHPVIIDVTKQDTIDDAVTEVKEALGGRPVGGSINNAGITVNNPLEFLTVEDLRWQLEVNLIGIHAVNIAFLPMLREAQGRLVMTGSVSGFMSSPLLGAYSMSKHAMEAMADALRMELYPQGIKVVLIEPGSIDTPIWNKGLADATEFEKKAPPEFFERYGKFYQGLVKITSEISKESQPPQVVLDVLVKALESKNPKDRYFCGGGVWQRKLLQWLPNRVSDYLILKKLGVR